MAYLALLWKARTIEKYRLKYEREKINSINSKAELRSTLYQKWTVYQKDSQKKFEQFYRKLCPEGSRLANSCTFLRENSSYVFRIVIGIVAGILTYFLCTVFVSQLSAWTVLGWVIAVAITLGIGFSPTARCLFLLLIPGLFSRVGRYTLACYALVLILTGPATNTLKNLDNLSGSLACGQEHIKSSVKEIRESKESPLNLVKETMNGTIEKIEYLATKMKDLMVKIHRLAMSIAHVFQSSLSWLNSIELTCNEKLGSPYEHCTKILEQGTKDCHKEFPELSNQWDWKLVVQAVCFNQQFEEPICVVGDFAKGSIVATVKKKLTDYTTRLQSLLATNIHIRRSHAYCNGSQPVSQAAAGVVTELRNRADTLLAWLSWTCALTGLFLMLIILRAKYYLHMFKTRSRFDNRYVTKELRELDLKRQRQGRETVLPLNTRERAKYVATSSIRLLPSERMYLTRSIVFMIITTLKLMIHMVADYSLYWVLMNVRFHGEKKNFEPPNRTERILVSGSGPLAATVRLLLEALSVPLVMPTTSTVSCLPNPHPPDLRRYAQIGSLIMMLWLLALFEPYGLRLRHVISGHYEPERAKARAVWLYYHIIRTRSCFLKYARRKLHRQFKHMSEEKYTFRNWLYNCLPCQCLRTLLRLGPPEPHCLLCCTKHRQEDLDRHLKRCETPSCPGVYCARCFMDIGQLCTICYSPEDYGDFSDVSLEKFASDDSSSDESDDGGDDNIPLMGTQDHEINDDEKGTRTNHNKKSNSSVFLNSRCTNGNQESTPLLGCDFLKKDYTKSGMIEILCNNNFNLSKVDEESINESEAILKLNQTDINDEITPDNSNQNEDKAKIMSSDQSRKAAMIVLDKVVTVNGLTFPKDKLGAIIKIMTLLTAKDENNTYNKHKVTIKHKPFEYLVMEMFQPFNRISEVRHNTCSANWQHGNSRDRYETSGNELRFLYDNLGFAGKSDSNEDIQNTDLQTDFNFDKSESILKYVQSAQESKEHTFTKLSKNLWFAKRNVKRFLDIKKSITNSVKEGSKYFKINYDKRFICKKRKRKNKSDVDLGLDSLVSKAFRNKSVDGVVIEVVEDSSTDLVNGSNAPANIRTPLEENQASRDAKQENDCNHKFLILSNFLKEETLDIRAVDENDEYLSKKSNDVNDVEIQNSGKLKTSAVQTKRQNTRKLGFWGSLRLRRRRTRSPHLFSINLKNEPSFYNFFTNYKRRKKRRFKKEENTDIERNVNEDTLSYRESRNLHEEESYKRMAKYSGILDMENTDILMGLEPTVFEGVNKEEPIEPKREAIFSDNEVNIQRAEIKPKLTERKLKAVEKRQVSRELEIRSANEFVIMYDDKNVAGDSAFRFGERLKTITHSLKKKKKRRSVVFSEEAPEVKYSDSDSEDTKHFIQVQSNDQLENEPQCVHQNMVCLNSDSDGTEIDEAKFEDNTKFTQYYNNNTAEIEQEAPCVHEWKVEPKKQGECQTCACEYDEDNLDTSSHSLVNRCFQVMLPAKRMSEMNSVAVNVVGSDEDSFDNPLEKGVQVKCVCPCNDRLKTELESEAVAKLQERWCNCEGKHDTNANADGNGNANASLNQTREAYTGFPAAEVKNTETQYLPTFHAAVQSYGISECFSKDRVPAKPVKGKVIKEVTERRLFWPDSDDVTLQYADEKTVKPKKNRSTTTVAKTVADASTITSDWWSPLLERKPMRRKTEMIIIGSNHSYDNKYNCPTSNWDSSLYRNDTASVLSASNYLIQSEQYYNQVYSVDIKTSSSRHKEVKEHKKYSVSEKPSFKMYRHVRKGGNKARRLKECYACRKKHLQVHSSSVNITPSPPKWKPVISEEKAHALKYYKCRNPQDKQKNQKPKIVKNVKDNLQYSNSQTNSNFWSPSILSSN